MDPAHISLYAALAALVLGLGIFAILLLLGLAVVRYLRLPCDLPEKIRFEVPPPALRDAAEKAGAPAVAAQRQAWGARLALARTVINDGLACQETLAALASDPIASDPAHAENMAALRQAGQEAIAAAEEAERMVDHVRTTPEDHVFTGGLEALAQRAADARRQMEAVLARLPLASGNRRIGMLLMVLVVTLVWLAAMRWLLGNP